MSKFDVGAFFVLAAWRRQKGTGGCPCKDAYNLPGQFWVLPLKISFGRRMEADLAPRNGLVSHETTLLCQGINLFRDEII
jgi:hypothetical protein